MKNGLTRSMLLAVCVAAVVCMAGCHRGQKAGSASAVEGKTYYTKYNLHYYMTGKDVYGKASIVNYVECPGHAMLPYNSQVTVETSSKSFTVVDSKSGTKIEVECPMKFAQKSPSEYVELIMSATPVNYAGLSSTDRKGIEEGRAINGMSKNGVMIALGYPAPFATPSLDSDTWFYWHGRMIRSAVNFKNGVVVSTGRAN